MPANKDGERWHPGRFLHTTGSRDCYFSATNFPLGGIYSTQTGGDAPSCGAVELTGTAESGWNSTFTEFTYSFEYSSQMKGKLWQGNVWLGYVDPAELSTLSYLGTIKIKSITIGSNNPVSLVVKLE